MATDTQDMYLTPNHNHEKQIQQNKRYKTDSQGLQEPQTEGRASESTHESV